MPAKMYLIHTIAPTVIMMTMEFVNIKKEKLVSVYIGDFGTNVRVVTNPAN